jgi:O-antigen/teichoic acid export membrane protein
VNLKSFFLDFVSFGFVSFISKCIALIIIPILTNNLNPGDYGVLELLIGISGIFSLIILMQLESYLARSWKELKNENSRSVLFSTLIITVTLFGFILLGIIFLTKNLIAETILGNNFYGKLILIIFTSSYFLALSGLPLTVLRMERKIKMFLIVNLFQSLLYFFLVIFLSIYENINLQNVIISIMISSTISLFISLFFTRRYIKFIFDPNILKPALRYGLPLMPAVAITWINNVVDQYALLYFFNTETVGEFSIIMKVAMIITLLVMIFRQTWLPYSYDLARNPYNRKHQFHRVLTLYYILALLISFVIVYFAEFIFNFIAPASYNIRQNILPVLLLANVVSGSLSIVNIGSMISGKTEWNSYSSLIGVSLNILLTFTLIPIFGVAGAAWGTLVANFFIMLILLLRSNRILSLNFSILNVLILSLVFLFFSFLTI